MRSLPMIAIVLGLAGLIPFVAASFGAVSLQGGWNTTALLALQAYAAVILAFLGGVHWGFGLDAAATQGTTVERARFGLGVLPSLVGWAGLLMTFIGLPLVGLALLTAGFVGLTIVEARASQQGLMPTGYMALRWVLSVIVIICLVSVLIVLAFGGHVVL